MESNDSFDIPDKEDKKLKNKKDNNNRNTNYAYNGANSILYPVQCRSHNPLEQPQVQLSCAPKLKRM